VKVAVCVDRRANIACVDVRVEPGAGAVDGELPDEATLGEQVERAVDRGLGDRDLLPNHPDETADFLEIRESVRKLCGGFPGAYWRELDRRAAYPTEFVKALSDAGFLAALIPTEYGGSGLSLELASAILEEVQRAGCNGAACHAQMYTMGTMLRHGSEEQKQRYLPGIASGALRLQAFGVTEPTSGTDTSSIKTFARRDGDHYVVSGHKVWTSRAEHSDLMLLLARTTPKSEGQKHTDGLSVFIVDMREAKGAGLSIRPIRTMMNHGTTEVFFDNVRVPAENLIGEEGKGFRYILSGMNAERILIAAECIGDAKWFIDRMTGYANERVVFGRPIGQNQGIQFPIAQAYVQMRAAELMVRQAASLFAAGRPCGAEANMAKMLAADASWAAADTCVQTYGGFGFAEEYDVERKFRETRLYRVAPISTNLILAYVAEHVLGLPRSY
jgi:acyl-CoA dehydrogenase